MFLRKVFSHFFIARKLLPGGRVTYLPKLPWVSVSQRYLYFLKSLANCLSYRVTHLAQPTFFFDRVTFKAGPTFLLIHCKHFVGSPRIVNLTFDQGKTIRACASAVVSSWLGQRGQLLSI